MPLDPIIARGMPDLGANALAISRENRQQKVENDFRQQRINQEQQQYNREQKKTVLGVTISRLAGIQDLAQREQAWAQLQGPIEQALTEFTGQPVSGLTVDQALGVGASLFGSKQAQESDRLYEYIDPKTNKPVYGRAAQAAGNAPIPQGASEEPSSVREWRFYNSLDDAGKAAYREMKRAGENPEVLYDANRARKAGEFDAEFIDKFPQVRRSYEDSIRGFDNTLNNIRSARGNVSGWTVGFMSNLGKFKAGTPQYDLQRKLEPILAAIGFDKLQNMRANSPTGGALGQVSERELTYLQSTIASLDQAQSVEQFYEALASVEKAYKQYKAATEKALREDTARYNKLRVTGNNQGGSAENNGGDDDPLGILK